MEQNGDHIFVSSAVGKGTAFSIYLPRYEAASSPERRRARPENIPGGHETILLVEDEIPLRRMLREALSKAGFRVWEAGNGSEALEYWGDQFEEIDLLVTDVVMPVMNGLQLAQQLRARRASLDVVFMTGHAPELVDKQGDMDPAGKLLQKPFLPAVLVRKVREVLDRKSAYAHPVRRFDTRDTIHRC